MRCAAAPGSAPLRGELEPREGVDGDRVGVDPAHVAEGDGGAASLQQRADARAEPGQVGASDRAGDREDDRFGRRGSHLHEDPLAG